MAVDLAAVEMIGHRLSGSTSDKSHIGALIRIHAGNRRLQHQLREAFQRAHQRHAPRKPIERVDEHLRMARVEKPPQELAQAALVALLRVEPARLLLALPRRLDRVVLHALDEARIDTFERPSTEQRLIEHVFVRPRRDARSLCCLDQGGIETLPLANGLVPLRRELG